MLTITSDQMKALSSSRRESFIRRMIRHLLDGFKGELAVQELAEEKVEPLVRRGLAEAEACGVVSERDVKLYIECMLILHPSFARHPRFPWAAQVLESKELTGTEKMDRIHNCLLWDPAHSSA